MKREKFVAVSVVLVVLCAGLVQAEELDWKTWDENGHQYAVVPTRAKWTVHRANAEAQSANAEGKKTYLVTITSEEEQQFVMQQVVRPDGVVPSDPWYCIGLVQDPTAAEPGQGWSWITGEPLEYTNWGAGEPNSSVVDEDYGYVTTSSGGWNDGKDGGATSKRGAVFERELTPSDTTPPAIALNAPDPAELAWSSAPASVAISGSVTEETELASAGLTITDEYGDAYAPADLMALLGVDGTFAKTLELSATVDAGDADGRLYTITLNAADKEGNAAEPVSVEVRVLPDSVAPTVELNSPEPASLPWERPDELKSVTISGTATDAESGIASVMLSVADEYGDFDSQRDITLDLDGAGNFSISLSLSSQIAGGDTGGRQYVIEVVATDLAGNISAPASVTVDAARPNASRPDKPGRPDDPGNGHRPDPPPGRR